MRILFLKMYKCVLSSAATTPLMLKSWSKWTRWPRSPYTFSSLKMYFEPIAKQLMIVSLLTLCKMSARESNLICVNVTPRSLALRMSQSRNAGQSTWKVLKRTPFISLLPKLSVASVAVSLSASRPRFRNYSIPRCSKQSEQQMFLLCFAFYLQYSYATLARSLCCPASPNSQKSGSQYPGATSLVHALPGHLLIESGTLCANTLTLCPQWAHCRAVMSPTMPAPRTDTQPAPWSSRRAASRAVAGARETPAPPWPQLWMNLRPEISWRYRRMPPLRKGRTPTQTCLLRSADSGGMPARSNTEPGAVGIVAMLALVIMRGYTCQYQADPLICCLAYLVYIRRQPSRWAQPQHSPRPAAADRLQLPPPLGQPAQPVQSDPHPLAAPAAALWLGHPGWSQAGPVRHNRWGGG